MSDTERGGQRAADCTYQGQSYPSGSKVCQKINQHGNDEHLCMECQDGKWVPTGKQCPPGSDGDPCPG